MGTHSPGSAPMGPVGTWQLLGEGQLFSFDGISTLIFLCSCEWPCSHVYTATLIGLSGSSKIKEEINNIGHGHSQGIEEGNLRGVKWGIEMIIFYYILRIKITIQI